MATNQNTTTRVEASTRGYHTFNPNAIKVSAFDWSFQGEMFKLVITPELPENEQTEKRRYDYDHSWITCLTRIKCLDLLNNVKEIVLPKIKDKVDAFVSVTVADVNQFGLGIKFVDGKLVSYAKLIRNINPNDLTSQDEIAYEFRNGEVIVNYDNVNGSFAERIQNNVEFTLFLKDMENFVNASSKAYTHANRVVEKFYKDQVLGNINAIGNKVGADIQTYNSAQKSGAKYGQTSLFDNTAVSAPSDTITSLDQLNIPMD